MLFADFEDQPSGFDGRADLKVAFAEARFS
jgi:hypothetical protein